MRRKHEILTTKFVKKKIVHPFFFLNNWENSGRRKTRRKHEILKKNVLNLIFFNILKIHKKFKEHSINIKNYIVHSHDMVHILAMFRENTSMRFRVTVRKLNVTDRQTDRGRCNISRPGPSARRWREIINVIIIFSCSLNISNSMQSFVTATYLKW